MPSLLAHPAPRLSEMVRNFIAGRMLSASHLDLLWYPDGYEIPLLHIPGDSTASRRMGSAASAAQSLLGCFIGPAARHPA